MAPLLFLKANVYSRRQRKLRLFFGFADFVLVWLAFELAYLLRSQLPLEKNFYFDPQRKFLLLLLSALSFWAVASWFGVYERLEQARRGGQLKETLRQTGFASVVIILAQYLLRFDTSRAFLLLFAGLTIVLLTLFRWNSGPLLRWYRQRFGAQHYALIIGTGDHAQALARVLEESAEHGLHLTGFFDVESDPEKQLQQIRLRKSYPVHVLEKLPQMLRSHVVDEILVAVPAPQLGQLEDTLLLCEEEGVRTRIAVNLFPHPHNEMYLDRLGSAPLLTFSGAPQDEVRLLLKRMIDVALAAPALLLLSPFLLLVTLLIRLTSPGPAIFRQERCGLNGRRITIYKFRSMVVNAEALKAELMHRNEKQLAFKIKDDPRLTPIGKWLRKFSIDELPQLWNVVKGDMSLVGPRPAVPAEVAQYERWQRRRLRMRPGLTCLWAVEGRDLVDFHKQMQLDMHYIDNWSLALDWKIIFLTIPQVMIGKGAH